MRLGDHTRVFPVRCQSAKRRLPNCVPGVVLLMASVLVPLTAIAQAAPSPPAPFPDTGFVTAKVIADGRTIFRGRGGCIVCHGQNLQGVIGPTLLEHPWKDAKGGSMAEIFRVVVSGVPGTAMLARPNGINDDQVKQVAAYVWAVNHRHLQP